MTGPLNITRPKADLCRKAGCQELKEHRWKTNKCGKRSWYCALSIGPGFPHGRIPSNMSKCPKEAQA